LRLPLRNAPTGLHLSDGREFGVEVAEVDPSADFTHRVEDPRVALLDAVDADPMLPLADRFLEFHFGPRAFGGARLTGSLLPAAIRRTLLRELLAYLRGGVFVDGPIRGYTTLGQLDISVSVSQAESALVNLSLPAAAFAPLGPLGPAIARVQRKIERACSYNRRDPLWLILGITEQLGVFTETVETLRRLAIAAGRFERVILTDGRTTSSIP
jgi:hypothetical protein